MAQHHLYLVHLYLILAVAVGVVTLLQRCLRVVLVVVVRVHRIPHLFKLLLEVITQVAVVVVVVNLVLVAPVKQAAPA
jgi:hypothetical protein